MSYSFTGRRRSFRPRRPSFNRAPKVSQIDRNRYVSTAVAPVETVVHQIEHAFTDFGLHQQLLTNIQRHGYTQPTPIQDQAIPVLMQGKDVVGLANTGTGKTAAFLLPFIHKVLNDRDQGVLILAPTRELALQIMEEFKVFTQSLPLSVTLCIGGMNIVRQIHQLQDNPHFVIGTPGRMKDLIMRRAFRPELFTNIVLDEVDRMLDIGFRKDIQFLISQLPQPRHGAFFSATMNREAEEIMSLLLSNPTKVSVEHTVNSQHIHQDIVRIQPGQKKVEVLHDLLIKKEFEKVIVFGRTKHGINKLEKELLGRGFRVCAIHGNKSQNVRQRSLHDFKVGRVQTLLATDIAARGIDVDGVTHVINYDEPQTYDDYIHRIGRTGRAGRIGKALTFVG